MRATFALVLTLTACTDDGLQPVGNSDTFADTGTLIADSEDSASVVCEPAAPVDGIYCDADTAGYGWGFLASDGDCGSGFWVDVYPGHTATVRMTANCGDPSVAITAADGSCALGSDGFERVLGEGRWQVGVVGGVGSLSVACGSWP